MAKPNPFAKFAKPEIRTARLKTFNDLEVKYRDLTMSEQDAFSKRLIKNYGKEAEDVELNMDELNKIKYEKAALILVDPKLTVEQMKQFTSEFADTLNEINALVDKDEDGDTEGNSKNP